MSFFFEPLVSLHWSFPVFGNDEKSLVRKIEERSKKKIKKKRLVQLLDDV